MRLPLRMFMAALAILFSVAGAKATDIYVLTDNNDYASGSGTNFGKVDSTTGVYTLINFTPQTLNNLTWNPVAGNFFVTEALGTATKLRTLSTGGILSASLGTIGTDIYGMAYRTSDSTLYAYDFTADATGTLNKSTGAWTTLNSSSGTNAYSPIGGRYTIMNDTMYLAVNFSSGGGIGTMGYTSTSSYNQIAQNANYAKMVLANNGTTLYGLYSDGTAGNQKLYTINPGTGALTAGPTISGTGLNTYFHGAAVMTTPVPEPSTYALAAMASGVMAAVSRRRKARQA